MKNCKSLLLAFVLSFAIQGLNYSAVPLTDARFASMQTELSASRLPIPLESARVPGQAYVIAQTQLEKSSAKTLADILRELPGVVWYDQTGNRFQPTIDIRGYNATPVPATLVLLDGVRMNEPDFGQVNWQLILMSDIAQVEVLPGPQTMYGPGALGGVINVTTKRGKKEFTADANAEMGSFGFQSEKISAAGPAGPLSYHLDASHEAEDGWRHNAASRLYRLSSRLDYQDDANLAWIGYRYSDDDLRQAGSLTADEIRADQRQNISFVDNDSLLHQGTLGVKRSLTSTTSLSFIGALRRRLENTPLNRGRTSVSTARANMDGLSGTIQMDDRRSLFERASALSLGFEWSQDKSDATSAGSFSGFPFSNSSFDMQRRHGLFAQESIDILPKLLILNTGLRWDHSSIEHNDRMTSTNSGVREFYHLSPRVGLNFNPIDSIETYILFAEAFRSPTIDEVNALGPFSSSPQLKPVRARSLEMGSRLHGDLGTASVSVSRSIAHDEIFPVYDPTAGFGQNRNIDKVRRDVIEVSLKPKWNQYLDGTMNYSYTEATFQTAFGLDKAPFPATQSVSVGDFLPQVPRHSMMVGVNIHPVKEVTVAMDEKCVSSQFVFGDESNTEPRIGGYCLLGAETSYEKGFVRVYVRGDNVLDRRAVSRGILGTNPGTFALERYLMPVQAFTLSAGLSFHFGG